MPRNRGYTVRLRPLDEHGRAPRLRLGVESVEEARAAVRRYVKAYGLRVEEFAPAEVLDGLGRRKWYVSHGGHVTDSPWNNGRKPRRRPHKLPANFGAPVYE